MIDDLVCTVAERRLAQICEAIGLEHDYFDRRRRDEARPVPNRDADEILADQIRLEIALFSRISEPSLRARLIELTAALAGLRR